MLDNRLPRPTNKGSAAVWLEFERLARHGFEVAQKVVHVHKGLLSACVETVIERSGKFAPLLVNPQQVLPLAKVTVKSQALRDLIS